MMSVRKMNMKTNILTKKKSLAEQQNNNQG